jgi:hypothetical protein
MGMDQRFVVQGENTEGEIVRYRRFTLLQTFFTRNYSDGGYPSGHCTQVDLACVEAMRFEVGCYIASDSDKADFVRVLDEIEFQLKEGREVFYSANW